ncbi:hypothetical protein MRX96_006162 [Rhipicephalus microplus]
MLLTDSQQICRDLLHGRMGVPDAYVLARVPMYDEDHSSIKTKIWIPVHAGLMGHLHVDRAARGCVQKPALLSLAADDPE